MAFNYLNSNFAAFAHRGGAYDYVENTLEAFEQSINLGFKYIEIDVQATKDNKLVIFHDPDLKRMLNLEIDISSINYDELSSYKINGVHKIPTFLETVSSYLKPKLIDCSNASNVFSTKSFAPPRCANAAKFEFK